MSRKMRYFVEWPKLPFSPTKFDAEMGSFGILVFVFLLPAWIKLYFRRNIRHGNPGTRVRVRPEML